jgi:predicted SnoaL-like aldol condensation-catalyzing enzyme
LEKILHYVQNDKGQREEMVDEGRKGVKRFFTTFRMTWSEGKKWLMKVVKVGKDSSLRSE